MRLTVLTQTAKGLPETIGEGEEQQPLRSEVLKALESIKWYLWHGNVFQALKHLQFAEMDLEGAAFENQEETTRKLLKAVEEFSTYIQRNRGFIPNYGERYRNGERISTGFVESAVNQSIKSSANGSQRSSRCDGHLEAHTSCYRLEPKFSTASSRIPSGAGIRLSAAKLKRRPHDRIAPGI